MSISFNKSKMVIKGKGKQVTSQIGHLTDGCLFLFCTIREMCHLTIPLFNFWTSKRKYVFIRLLGYILWSISLYRGQYAQFYYHLN